MARRSRGSPHSEIVNVPARSGPRQAGSRRRAAARSDSSSRGSTLRVSVVIGLLLVLLGGCASTPTASGLKPVDLEGLWLVTPGPGTTYGAGGTTTLEFGAAGSGSATYLSKSDANDITTCRRDIYAALTDKVVLLAGAYYEAGTVTPDKIELENGTNSITLDRVTGTPPVPPCAQASVTQVASNDAGAGGFTGLNAVGPRLYFNIDDVDDSVVAFDTVSGTFGASRNYTSYPWVMAARSDDLFYGHCGCGGSTKLSAFNLTTGTPIATANTVTDFGVDVSLRFGYFDGTTVVVGGRDHDHDGINVLLRVDSDTLALQSQRQILNDVYVQDLTLRNGELLALTQNSIITVAANGRADQTVALPSDLGLTPKGIAAIGNTVYLLAENERYDALLFEVTMP